MRSYNYELCIMNYELLRSLNCLCTVRTYAENGDRGLQLLLKICDVVLECLWKLSLACHLCEVGLPSRQLCVNSLAAFCLKRHVGHHLIAALVGCANLYCLKSVKHVALHHDELCNAVYHDGILQSHEVNPSAAAIAACHCSILVTDFAQGIAGFIEQLHRERTRAYTCRVSLEYSIYVADCGRTYAETGAYAA